MDITLLQTLGLKKGSTLSDIREAYLRLTTQRQFQKVILGDESLEKEFKEYHETYTALLKLYPEAGASPDMRYYPPEQASRFLFNSGVYHLIVRNYIKAGEKLEAAHRTYPNDVLVPIYLGILLMKRKNYYAAEKYFLQAVELDADNEDGWFYLAENHYKAGNYAKALQLYEKVKGLNPSKRGLSLRFQEITTRLHIKGYGSRGPSLIGRLTNLFKK